MFRVPADSAPDRQPDLLTLVIATAEAKELLDVLSKDKVSWETFIQTELKVFAEQTIDGMTSAANMTTL